jgi:multiple sugar transport system ATP-binding protein
MNLVNAELSDDRVVFANGDRLPIPLAFQNSTTRGRKIIFGLRPDDLYPSGHGLPSDSARAVHEQTLKVNLTEPLGNETLVFFDFAGQDWLSRMLNPRPLIAGGSTPVSFDLAKAHLFDAESGVALSRTGG